MKGAVIVNFINDKLKHVLSAKWSGVCKCNGSCNCS